MWAEGCTGALRRGCTRGGMQEWDVAVGNCRTPWEASYVNEGVRLRGVP